MLNQQTVQAKMNGYHRYENDTKLANISDIKTLSSDSSQLAGSTNMLAADTACVGVYEHCTSYNTRTHARTHILKL